MNSKKENDLILQSEKLLKQSKKRRTVRFFSKKNIPRSVIENCIAIAGTAPSGANMQPWTFVLVEDSKIKNEIRNKAEEVEKEFKWNSYKIIEGYFIWKRHRGFQNYLQICMMEMPGLR